VGATARSEPVHGATGQAAVELVGALPILIGIVLGAAQLLAAGLAAEQADHAAQAGAMAILQGGDPERAARDALPGWARARLDVAVHDDRVEVAVDPPGPAHARRAEAVALTPGAAPGAGG
jgi:hypothetical protein